MDKLKLQNLLEEVACCQLCSSELPFVPRPVVVANSRARLLIIGQAPGLKVHRSGIPWDDASGQRLRDWLLMSPEQFYDQSAIAIMPMAFCYPGRGRSGDNPPRKECAPQWHSVMRAVMPNIKLTILIGQYAQRYYLRDRSVTVTQCVREFDRYSGFFPLPHPSPRNNLWLVRNPWFEREVLPTLRREVSLCLNPGSD